MTSRQLYAVSVLFLAVAFAAAVKLYGWLGACIAVLPGPLVVTLLSWAEGPPRRRKRRKEPSE